MPNQSIVCQNKTGDRICEIEVHLEEYRKSAKFLFISDVHFDSSHCDRSLLETHLRQATELGSGVISVGDWHDAMQGKNDKRSSKSEIRPENNTANYYDTLCENSAQYLVKHCPRNLIAMSCGNHETSVLDKNEIDLTKNTVKLYNGMRSEVSENGRCIEMPYRGYYVFTVFHNGKSYRTVVGYHHGFGGGGATTHGITHNARMQMSYECDVFFMGHVHQNTDQVFVREYVSANSKKIIEKNIIHSRIPGYKIDHGVLSGFSDQKGMCPKPRGGKWLIFYWCRDRKTVIYEVNSTS